MTPGKKTAFSDALDRLAAFGRAPPRVRAAPPLNTVEPRLSRPFWSWEFSRRPDMQNSPDNGKLCLHFSPELRYLAYIKRYLYSVIMARSVQKCTLVSQF